MLKELNGNAKESVSSLDILSHGTPYSLNFSEVENENCGIVTGFMATMMLKIYYSTWEDGIYSFNIHSRYVSNIDYSIFTKDDRVQLHGCNTARGSLPGDTLAEALSKELHDAGKTSAYVIGHTTPATPLIKGGNGKTSIKDQDYRHGERAVIVNGKIMYKTKSIGLLKHNEVLNKLEGGGV